MEEFVIDTEVGEIEVILVPEIEESVSDPNGSEILEDVTGTEGVENEVVDTEEGEKVQLVEPAALSESSSETVSTVEVVVDTEYLKKMNTSLSIVSMILLFWCGAWMLRSWRTHMLKGGK